MSIRCILQIRMSNPPTRPQVLYAKAHAERELCRDWLLAIMRQSPIKTRTKDDLRAESIARLNVSKSSFDFAWIDAIETTGLQEWYEPLRKRKGRRAIEGWTH
jgi:hypothetical protein